MIDLIIIGAGPIGLACGISAQEKGLNYSIIEKGALVNSLFNYPLNMSFFSTSDRLEIGNIPFISQQPKPTRAEALEYYRRVASSKKLKINLYEEITAVIKSKTGFNITTTTTKYSAKAVVIATGYYSEPHPYFGMNLAIIGSANSAVDAALETYRKGAKSVTMIIREKEIGENVKYWARPDIINRIKEGSIKAYFESNVKKIADESILISSPKKEFSIKNDFVLAMTGYQPNFKLLEDLGVSFKNDEYKTPVYNDKTMESNVPGVYLAGVVCGGLKTNKWFIENSREHAPKIIQDIFKG
jgi:thioredoxin reductase (NADPH)